MNIPVEMDAFEISCEIPFGIVYLHLSETKRTNERDEWKRDGESKKWFDLAEVME